MVGTHHGVVHHNVLVFLCVFLAQAGDTQPFPEAEVNWVLVTGD
jgi:hypothetical protein